MEDQLTQRSLSDLHARNRMNSQPFRLQSKFAPTGDQPEAIAALTASIKAGNRFQSLLGVTGSGKTFTMANVIANVQRPTLVIAHTKTLAAQLCAEFKAMFPTNAVEYYVSYYDYYQPESYVAQTDTYIEKDASINEEIDRLSHLAISSVLERRDVIIVATVSCIYGLISPLDYINLTLSLRVGQQKSIKDVIAKLVSIQYERNDFDFQRGKFRLHGDVLDIFPIESENIYIRVNFFDTEIESIYEMQALNNTPMAKRSFVSINPASRYLVRKEAINSALDNIRSELRERLQELQAAGKVVEAYRLEQRTNYDLAMMQETGFCKGIENYSRHLSHRAPASAPYTIIDFFPDDFLLMVDESHMTIPQIGAMYLGDRSRKQSLVDYGFRLPSCFDNRPLKFEEFIAKIPQALFVSATLGPYERQVSLCQAEQIIRPTGLLDPEIEIHKQEDQIAYALEQVNLRIRRDERSLLLTTTKKLAEEISEHLQKNGIKSAYIHADVPNQTRSEILRDLRFGKYDVLVGINLLREGIDLPEVSLICIFDADKQGLARSTTSLIQIIGRASRNSNGHVIMFADTVSPAMLEAISETNRRRKIQTEYNEKHHIVPQTVKKDIRELLSTKLAMREEERKYQADKRKKSKKKSEPAESFTEIAAENANNFMSKAEIKEHYAELIKVYQSATDAEKSDIKAQLQSSMQAAVKELDFETAAKLRDLNTLLDVAF